jgi:hypothetical protein
VKTKENAMELLDRYLQAVKKHLPWKRQDDIIAELRANLEAQLEDKESALGRPLTQGETEDWLRQIGPPIRVAARYQPQQFLIGPALFPTYWFVLRLAFMWSMIIYAIVSALQIATQTPNGAAVLVAVLRAPGLLMTVAAWVTLIFAIIEFAAAHYPEKCPEIAGVTADWSPGTLPPLEKEEAGGKKPRSFAHAVAEEVFGFLFLIWLLLVPHYPYLLLGPGVFYLPVTPFQLAPVWVAFYWSVVALNVLQLVWRSVDLARGAWQKTRRLEHIVMSAFGLIPLGLLATVRDQVFVTLKHPVLDQARYGATVDSINKSIHLSALILCAIAVLSLAWEIGQMSVDAYRKRVAAVR